MTTDNVPAIGPRKTAVWITRAISYLLYFYIIAVEIILILGFFLLLFGANPSAEFTQWAYRNLDRVMEPFRGIFTPIELGTTAGNVEAVFETSVVFAMIVYGILGAVVSSVIPWLSGRMQHLEAAEAEAQRQRELDRMATATPGATAPATISATATQQTPPPF
ncbi:MAG: hypothetical protein M3P52_12360 [Actinomycetota bacterium]|nr:hypothetical protein [Actinomycetota bacterium]